MPVILSNPIAVVPYVRSDGTVLSAYIYYIDGGAIPQRLGLGTVTPNISIFYVVRGWYSDHNLYYTLFNELVWSESYANVHGKIHKSRRLVNFCGDVEADQTRTHIYSSYAHPIKPWHPGCKRIRDDVHREIGVRFNSCLSNYYMNGDDYIAYHGDKEVNDPLQSVVTVSLGSTRRFYLKSNANPKDIIKTELHSGDLVVMTGNLQRTHKHTIPVQSNVGPRISVTFRILRING